MAVLRLLFGDEATVLREGNFQLLLLSSLLPALGTALLSPVLDSLIEPFGTSPANIGLVMSAFTAPAIVMIPVAGVLADRCGRKPVLVGSLLLFGLAGTAIVLTTDFRLVLALRLFQGVAFGGINPTIITSIGDIYAGDREATAQGLRFTSAGLSATLFPLVSGLLVLLSWQYPFLIYTLSYPVALAIFLWFEEPVSPEATASDGGDRASYRRELFALVRHRRVLAILVARGMPNILWIGFLTYNSLIVVRLMGGTPPQAGLLVAVGSLTFAAVASQAGRITALFDSRFVPLAIGNLTLTAGFTVVFAVPDLWVATVGIVVGCVGFGTLLSLYRSVITGLGPDHLRAGLVSFAEAGGRVSNTLTPIVMGAAIGAATPVVGFGPALQLTGLGATLVGGGVGTVCLLVARYSPPVSVADEDALDAS